MFLKMDISDDLHMFMSDVMRKVLLVKKYKMCVD
nr:MAG TPA: hypothetical protein [Caudoviricetes sp.]